MMLINKSASAPVLRAVISLLEAGLAESGLPVYDVVPAETDLPFVVVRAMSETEDSTKTDYGSRVQVEISNYAEALESKTVQERNSMIIGLLEETDITVEGFYLLSAELLRNDCAEMDVENVWSGSLTVEFSVQELPAAPAAPAEQEGEGGEEIQAG